MRKLIKLGVVAMLTACVAGFSSATTLIDTGFKASDTPAYANGDLAGQNGWAINSGAPTNAFNVTDAAGNGFADTAGTMLSTNGGNYLYYTTPVGNGVSNELSGSLDFTLGSSVASLQGGDIFRVGISATVTNGLNTGDTNQTILTVSTTATGILKIQTKEGTNAATTLCQMPAAEAGWSATEVPFPVTDSLRLTWKIRKTAVANTYVLSATLTNLVNASTNSTGNSSLVRADAYAAGAPYFMMGHASGAFSTNNNGIIDIAIDNLSVTNNTDVVPTLFPTKVSANSGDLKVELVWSNVVEATSYDLVRSDDTTNSYNLIINLPSSTTFYTDYGVINGHAYYYKVIAKAAGAADAASAPVSGEPNDAITGTILNTGFRNTDSPAYAAGDLAGQNSWKSIAASGAPAFYVDPTGNGFASTAPYSNYFDNVNGNQVYLNQIMSNAVGAAWSGTTVFTLTATPEVQYDKIKTNTVDGVVTVTSNTQMVAVMPNGRVFELGITSDSTAVLNPNDKKYSALITGRSTAAGDFNVLLNGYNATINLMIAVPRENMGWDPEWATTNAAPDFQTDPITLNWEIRKTASNNVYSGKASLTVGTNSYTGLVQFTDEITTAPVTLYAAPLARFAMSHSFASQSNSAATMVDVSIDSLSLSHSNDAPIIIATPFSLSGVVGNTNILLSWQGAVEASSFEVWRSDGYGATNYVRKATVTNVWSYLDSNLTDLQLYNYYVIANYAATNSPASTNMSIRARTKTDVLKWDAVGKVAVNSAISQTNRVVVTNGSGGVVCNIYGNYADGAIVYPGQGPGTYSGIPVYGVAQVTGSLSLVLWQMIATSFEEVTANKTLGATNRASALLYIKATNGPIDMTSNVYAYDYSSTASGNIRAAFRDGNSGKWYVSDNTGSNVSSVGALSMGNMADPTNQWRELTVAQDQLMCGTNNPVTVPDFTAVNAIGFMAERTTANFKPTLLKISSIGALPTVTISNITTDVRGSVVNNTATPTNNPLVVSYGDSPTFTIAGTNGTRVLTLTTNGVPIVGMILSNTSTKVTYTWTNVTANGTLEATFTNVLYTLAITNGSGSGFYTNGTAVPIVADPAPVGQVFAYWSGNTNYLVATNVFDPTNMVIMGTRNLTMTANYITPVYTLTVSNGIGTGDYTNGQRVVIIADAPATNRLFDQWVGNTYYVDNVYDSSTTVTMPATNIAVMATYRSANVTLTATVSGGNGTISPASASVVPGNSTNFVITANNYYRISTLTTNGASAGVSFDNSSTNYNFIWSNVQAAGTVTVSFAEQVTTGPAPVPYSWLAQYFVTNDYNAAALADQDADGAKTWQEYIANTVPTNKASVFTATQATRNVITWTAQSNRIYSVYWTTNLVTKVFTNKQDNVVGGAYTNTTPDARVNLYQVKVRMQ